MKDPDPIRVGRRRKIDKPAGSRERAEAPERRRPQPTGSPTSGQSTGSGGGIPRPPSGSGGMTSPSLGLPGGGSKSSLLIIGLVIVLAICVLPFVGGQLLGGDGDLNSGQPPFDDQGALATELPQLSQPGLNPTMTSRPKPTAFAYASGEGDRWLVMLYQDADDKILEQDIYIDLNEAERVGSSDRVQIIAQIDRYNGGYQGDGNWTTAKRFLVTQDDDLNRVHSEMLSDLGEVNMASADTLVDFVSWAIQTYPADKYALILSDHGLGWPGGWSDPTSTSGGDARIPLSNALGDQLYLMELEEALAEIRDRTGLDKFELLGMDACLMSHLEVFTALRQHSRYAVASQETEPALGWAYSSFLGQLVSNPDMDGAELGRAIVSSYIIDDQRIVDDQARAEFLRPNSPLGGIFGTLSGPSTEQITRQLERDMTITTVDLQALPELINSLNEFAYAMQSVDQKTVAKARSFAQSFTSIFGSQVPPSYIDLGHFVQLLARESGDSDITRLSQEVLSALNQTVIAEKHGSNKSGATGISIYFPNSTLYSSPATGAQSYVQVSNRFASETLWDDFLLYHYIGDPFKPAEETLMIPESSARISAPGAEGGITLSPIRVSSNAAAPGSPILLSTDVQGNNISYAKLFVGMYDANANSIYLADSDYLESDQTRELNGIYYPVWDEDGSFTLEFEWEPVVFAINDGIKTALALFNPQSYGKSAEDAVYTVDAIYTYADSGDQRHARLYFRDGYLRQVFGFTGDQFTGAPREIIPQAGDHMTILEKWMDLDQNGRVVEIVMQEGETLTFGEEPFTWDVLDAPVGNYVVGFILEDQDGNAYEVFTNVSVQ
jgi:hypothetical protein